MGVISWVITICLIVGVVFGFARGAGKSRPFKLSLLCGFALGYFVGIPIATAIMSTSFGTETITGFYLSKISSEGIFATDLSALDLVTKQTYMSEALSEMNFPSFIRGFFVSNAYILDGTVADAIASSFAYWTLVGCFFLFFFIVVFIILGYLFNKFKELIFGEDGKGLLGRVFGAIRGFIKGALLMLVLMCVIVIINQLMVNFGYTTLQDFLTDDLALNGSSFSIGKLFYNTANTFFNWISL